jgi:hypothetical protein
MVDPVLHLWLKLRELVQLCFIKKNSQRRYKYLMLGRDRSYFVRHHSDSTNKFSETDIFNPADRIHANNLERGFVEHLADSAI